MIHSFIPTEASHGSSRQCLSSILKHLNPLDKWHDTLSFILTSLSWFSSSIIRCRYLIIKKIKVGGSEEWSMLCSTWIAWMLHSRIWLSKVYFVGCLCCLLLLVNADGQGTHPAEVTALQSIKRSLIDPNRNLSNWNHGDPCLSKWTGVLCFNSTMVDGYLHVRELQLMNMNLSGTLSPELGRFSYMEILDVMWNNISGSIPKEIGNITTLILLLVNGNQLTGSLPEELGNLQNLNRLQIDQNQISGPLPKSFGNMKNIKHFHMNNNSLSGKIPPEIGWIPQLWHMLFDNNNLSGHLPPELGNLSTLYILQLDNNHLLEGSIPDTYGNMHTLMKISLRNCSLQGPVPDLSRIKNLTYIDLSLNHLNGSIPPAQLSTNITTVILSNNNLTGTVPSNFSNLPQLQKLSLENNLLSDSVASSIWKTRTSNVKRLIVDMQNNLLTGISGSTNLPPNVTVRLQGNPLCSTRNLGQFCGSQNQTLGNIKRLTEYKVNCPAHACPTPYEYSPTSPIPCLCSAPLLVGFRLKSPGFSDFLPYKNSFDSYITSGLYLNNNQLDHNYYFIWEEGPRLRMSLKFFPAYTSMNSSYLFNRSEVVRIRGMFTGWKIHYDGLFGPYELLYFPLWGPYIEDKSSTSKSGISKGAVAGIVLGTVAGGILLSAIVSLIVFRFHTRKRTGISKGRPWPRKSIKIEGVKRFPYSEVARATNHFDASSQVGEGGYGKVYRGILDDGTVVAIKRAQEGSLQGEKEFLNEIELLSRLHHRNLVSLVGYCDEEGEQMLIYEYMSNGTLREHLNAKSKEPLRFAMRLRIALESAKGIHYLHNEADPSIFHRDIKATNILLDSKYTAKVADFGLSRLGPVSNTGGVIPSYVSTAVKGTPGYLDPEYFFTQKLTDKSDVYSLGVVFLELLTGKHPISHGKSLITEVNDAYGSGKIFSVIDDKMGPYPSEGVEKFVRLTLKCCRDETDARPFIAEVVRELESILAMIPDSETTITGLSLTTDPDKTPPSPCFSSQTKNPYTDIFASEPDSAVSPTINPR